jgi:hypothetical protein
MAVAWVVVQAARISVVVIVLIVRWDVLIVPFAVLLGLLCAGSAILAITSMEIHVLVVVPQTLISCSRTDASHVYLPV